VAAGHRRGPVGSDDWSWDWAHLQFLVLPALTMSVIPMGIIARTVRALVADILDQEFIVGLRAKGSRTSACSATWSRTRPPRHSP
jgi:peptide/nickel transport system permease protein